jgi:hypothetical protein
MWLWFQFFINFCNTHILVFLFNLNRRKGAVANAAQELALVFQEIMS